MTPPLRALLLSAGLGTRLRPLTNHIPKCLVNVGRQPILYHWLDKLYQNGFDLAIVNTHYLSDHVSSYVLSNPHKLPLTLEYEPQLLGTAGTLMANSHKLLGSINLLAHADNYMVEDLSNLLQAHLERPSQALLTMLTFRSSNPSSCGIVEIDDNKIVQSFHEKPSNPTSNLANAAVYLFDSSLLQFLNELPGSSSDFSCDVLPHLIGKIYTYETELPFVDIGTPEALDLAQGIEASYANVVT